MKTGESFRAEAFGQSASKKSSPVRARIFDGTPGHPASSGPADRGAHHKARRMTAAEQIVRSKKVLAIRGHPHMTECLSFRTLRARGTTGLAAGSLPKN
jgi:hypothetical protein